MNILFETFESLDIGDYIIRKLRLDDFEDIFSIYGDYETMKYDIVCLMSSIDDAKESIKMIEQGIANKWFIRWGIVDKYTGELIGTITLHDFDFSRCKVEIGYNLKRIYWKQGIMSTVLKSLIDYLANNTSVKEIEAVINNKNIASIKLVEKSGFKLDQNQNLSNEMIVFRKFIN